MGKIEVNPVFDKKVITFYWIAILFLNSLGTAFGDILSDNNGFSYFKGALVTVSVIAFIIVLHYITKISHLILFWVAFVFTRPFGSRLGDWLTKTTSQGDLNIGTIPATFVNIALLGILFYYSHIKKEI